MVKRSFNHTSWAILGKELFRTLGHNWKQFISVIAISFLSICLFCGLTSNAENLSERRDKLYQETNFADLYVTTTSLDEGDYEYITSLPGVTKAEKRLYIPAFSNNSACYLIIVPDDATLSIPYMVTGEKGFVLPESLYQVYQDHIPLEFVTSLLGEDINNVLPLLDLFKLKNGTDLLTSDRLEMSAPVTGSMYHPESVQNSDFTPAVFYINEKNLADLIISTLKENYSLEALDLVLELFNRPSLESVITDTIAKTENQIILDSNTPEETLEAIDSYFDKKENNNLVSASLKEDLTCYTALDQEVHQSMALTYVFPLIFFLVSVLVILTTLSQMIFKQRSQIGALKAIGVPKYQIYIHYTSYGMVLCAIGALLGFFIGPAFIPNVLGVKYNLLWVIPSSPIHFFYPMSICLCILLVLFAGLCSFLVSWSVIKEKPVDTLRPKASKKVKNTVKDNSFIQKHTSLELRMALRNIVKAPARSLMVAIGMLGCCSLLVCGFGIMDTLNYGIHLDLFDHQHFDLLVTPLNADNSTEDYLLSQPGVERMERYTEYPATVTGEKSINQSIFLLDDNSQYLNIPMCSGYVTIDEVTADRLGIDVGDDLTIVIDSQVYHRQVYALFESSFLNGIYEYSSDYPEGTFKPSSYILYLEDGYDVESLAEELRKDSRIINVQTPQSVYDTATDITSTISIMTSVIEVFAILLSIVVIYNLSSLNITERSRDIATMKVLGFRYKEITKTLTYEIMIDVVAGSLLGLACGFPLMWAVLYVNRTDLLNFLYHINWYTYLIAFAIAVVSSLAVTLLLCLKTKRISISESLKSVE